MYVTYAMVHFPCEIYLLMGQSKHLMMFQDLKTMKHCIVTTADHTCAVSANKDTK